MNDKTYDKLNWLSRILLPRLATLVTGLSLLFGWTNAAIVAGVMELANAFVGGILSDTSKMFFDKKDIIDKIELSQIDTEPEEVVG